MVERKGVRPETEDRRPKTGDSGTGSSVGVLLLNLGGPEKLSDVSRFLYRLFSDPDILVGVPAGIRHACAAAIALAKGGSSRRMYESIGGGSPQLKWTRAQAIALEREPSAHMVEVGMRAWEPGIGAALAKLRERGAERLVFLPLFPQFSTTTTGSCFKEAHRCLEKMSWFPPVREVRSWPDHPAYVGLLRGTIAEALAKIDESGTITPDSGLRTPDCDLTSEVHVLFSAHSLPMKLIERGDPYPGEVDRTVRAAAQGLRHPWSVAYQSRNGPIPWLRPYVEEEIDRLARAGVRRMVVVPVSFVSDHIETLYELDLLYAGHAREHGIQTFERARVFNDDPAFIRALASFVASA